MVQWYKDGELSIFLSERPHVCMRYVLPSSTVEERKSIEKYPFINKKQLEVALFDNIQKRSYRFVIPKGYCYDGASIPRLFWRVIGSNTDNRFLIPALIHDVLCENHNYVNSDRNFSSRVFRALLISSGVNKFKAQMMYLSVDNFQRLCGWDEEKS